MEKRNPFRETTNFFLSSTDTKRFKDKKQNGAKHMKMADKDLMVKSEKKQ